MKTKLKHTAEELDRAHREGLEKGRMEEHNRFKRQIENDNLWRFVNAANTSPLKDMVVVSGGAVQQGGDVAQFTLTMGIVRLIAKRIQDYLLKDANQ